MKEDIFDELKKYCPRGYVTRDKLKRITGGLICGRTMANLIRQVKAYKIDKSLDAKLYTLSRI